MASALFNALGSLAADGGEAAVKNRAFDLAQKETESQMAARSAATGIQQSQLDIEKTRQGQVGWDRAVTFKDPTTGKFKQYNPMTMVTREMPAGFDPTYDPAKDPTAILARGRKAIDAAEQAGIKFDEPTKTRLLTNMMNAAMGVKQSIAVKAEWVRNPDTGELERKYYDVNGNVVGSPDGAINTTMLPTTSTSTTQDPIIGPITTTSTKQKVLPNNGRAATNTRRATATSAPATTPPATVTPITPTSVDTSKLPAPSQQWETKTSWGQAGIVSQRAAQAAAGKLGGIAAIDAMAKDWVVNGVQPPPKYRPYVQSYMKENNLQALTEETAQTKNTRAAIKDVMPVLDRLDTLLAAQKDKNSWLDVVKQAGRYGSYVMGKKVEDPVEAEKLRLEAFVRIAGAAPWIKVGRGKYIYEEIIKHLPNPSRDTPALAYDKIQGLKQIFREELARPEYKETGQVGNMGGMQSPSQADLRAEAERRLNAIEAAHR